MKHIARDMMCIKWCVIVTLMSVLSACGADTGSAREGLSSGSVESHKVELDSVFVNGVGMLPKAEVYRRFMNYRQLKGSLIYGDEVINYAEAIIRTDDTSAVDSLLVFAERFRAPAPFAIGVVVEQKSSKFPSWLKKHAEILDSSDWRVISATMQRVQWRDSTAMAVMMDHVKKATSSREAAVIARTFTGVGTLNEVRVMGQIADTTSSDLLFWAATSSLTRYDRPDLNRQFRRSMQRLQWMRPAIEAGIKRHNRYDFLPEVRELERRLEADDVNGTLSFARELITYLEEKKQQGAPLGMPLDWPETTWEEKESVQPENDTD